MPDLPSVMLLAKGLQSLVGRTVVGVEAITRRKLLRGTIPLADLSGTKIQKFERRGKLLMFDFGKRAAVLHLGRTGTLRWSEDRDPDKAQQKLCFHLDGRRLWWVDTAQQHLGWLWLWPSWEALVCFGPQRKFGVDILSPLFTDDWLDFQLHRSRRVVANALMDQQTISGADAWLRTEALWTAKQNPRQYASELTFEQAKALRQSLVSVVAQRLTKTPFQVWQQLVCPRCGTALCRESFQRETLFWCPSCQR